MKNLQVKCSKKRRLFDAIDGSRIRVKIKCNNSKACPHKANCKRISDIVLGADKDAFSKDYKAINCPHCGKRLFDTTTDSVGIVTIKCEMCSKVATIPIVAEQK